VSGEKVIAELTIVGPDRKGVVAGVTGFVFQNRGNIEKISQSVTRGLFGMQLEASFPASVFDERGFQDGIRAVGRRLGMRIRVHFDEPDRLKNMAVLVSKEPHCLEALLEARRAGRIRARIPVVIGTHPSLKALVEACHLDLGIDGAWAQCQKQLRALYNAQVRPTAATIAREYGQPTGYWYAQDWRGQKGQPPAPHDVTNTWGAATTFKAVKTNGHPRAAPNGYPPQEDGTAALRARYGAPTADDPLPPGVIEGRVKCVTAASLNAGRSCKRKCDAIGSRAGF
jgi:predicted amino acid-binding ACT domain protein